MDFNLTEEHLMIQQAARDFAQAELQESKAKKRLQTSEYIIES